MLIAEVGLAHDGSLGNALAFIDAVADAGADAVKFQCHDGDTNEKLPQSGCALLQDGCRQEYWKRTGFTFDQFAMLKTKAHSRNIKFGVTPFSIEALEKVAPLCDFLKISRGMHSLIPEYPHQWKYKQQTIVTVDGFKTDSFSKPFQEIELNNYYPDVELYGISDHSGTIWPCIRAAALGASIYEVHVTWDRRAFGPDQQYSLTINELATLAEGIKAVRD